MTQILTIVVLISAFIGLNMLDSWLDRMSAIAVFNKCVQVNHGAEFCGEVLANVRHPAQ